MPRSFLVKKHHGKRPKNGRLRPPEPEEAPRDPREDPQPNDGAPLRHSALAQRALSHSSSSSSCSSCSFPLRADRLHPPPSLSTSPLWPPGRHWEPHSRSSADPREPLEACTKEDLEIRHVRGDRRRPETLLPPSLPFLALCPAVPLGGGEEALGCLGCPGCRQERWSFPGLAKHGQHRSSCFSCRYCEKEYVSQGALKMHIRTHTLPCVCELCGKAFSRPWLLQGHMRTHTGEKPFSCFHCSRAFADRSNLRAHLQTHSDVKKHQCGGCFKTFSRISLLAKHQDAGCPPS